MTIAYQKAQFVLSAADIKQLPPDTGVEVAIVGRSNAGKSSILNRLTKQKQLARVSKVPGRTQLINVFRLVNNKRLIDLPGYGFAKVPLSIRQNWQKMISTYFAKRMSLKGVILVMDIRHPLKTQDEDLLFYCEAQHLKVHVLLNKADKLKREDAIKALRMVEAKLQTFEMDSSLQLFSALNGEGLISLEDCLNEWYG